MRATPLHKIAARLAFAVGLSLMILGSVILVAGIAGASRLAALPASFALIIGISFAVLAIKLNRTSQYLFLSAFFVQTGLLLLLLALKAIPVGFSKLWPLLSLFAGTSLLPAARHRSGLPLSRYLVPALGFVSLGGLLLIFSFDVVPFSFKSFFLDWWPVLLLLVGFLLFLISLNPRDRSKENES